MQPTRNDIAQSLRQKLPPGKQAASWGYLAGQFPWYPMLHLLRAAENPNDETLLNKAALYADDLLRLHVWIHADDPATPGVNKSFLSDGEHGPGKEAEEERLPLHIPPNQAEEEKEVKDPEFTEEVPANTFSPAQEEMDVPPGELTDNAWDQEDTLIEEKEKEHAPALETMESTFPEEPISELETGESEIETREAEIPEQTEPVVETTTEEETLDTNGDRAVVIIAPEPFEETHQAPKAAPEAGQTETPVKEPDDALHLPGLARLLDEPVKEEALLPLEPYHTIDYFASQGIKVDRSLEKPEDSQLDRQVKSFTEWLRSMKKLSYQPAVTYTDPLVEKQAINSLNQRDVVTEAMAEVWQKQGNYEEAARVYAKLMLLHPEKTHYFAARLQDLKAKQ